MKATVLGLVLAAGISIPALGREIVVDLNGGAEFTAIQPAIDAAEDGDTVLVKPGEYVITEPVSYKGKAITLRSQSGPEVTTIRMSEVPRDRDRACVVIFESGDTAEFVLEGFTLTGGQGVFETDIEIPGGLLGGGVFCAQFSSPTLVRCRILRNAAAHSGGGVFCASNSSPSLRQCTILGNAAGRDGGGVHCEQKSAPELTNCVIAGNSAGFNGGGLFCHTRSAPTLINCTITQNRGRVGGMAVCCGSSPTVTNCIIWGNDEDIRVISSGRTVDVSYSCIGGQLWNGEGNINQEPLFVSPGTFDYGRFTGEGLPDFIVEPGNYHLKPGSPCIDSGTSDGAPTTDIEGNGRPCGAGVDMGAYESGDCPPQTERFTRGDANADGNQNLTDAVFVLDHLFGGGTEPTCAKSADMNDSGAVDLTDPVFLLNFLFLGRRPSPPAPFAECGFDPTPDDLTCESFQGCQ